LSDLRDRFGSLYLAAAAYNAGAGKVSRSLGKLEWDAPAADTLAEAADTNAATELAETAEAVQDTLAEDLADSLAAAEELAQDSSDITSDAAFFRLASTDLLAAETQDYVPKLIAAALIAKAPARYGFTPPAPAPFTYDSIVVTQATGLDVVARLAGTSVAVMRDLNPQYLRLATPPRRTSVIRVPEGTAATVGRRVEQLGAKARVHYLTHVTGRRERLSTIAARYHLPMREIQAANPKLKTTRPARGTRVVIPAVAVPSALAMRATGTIGGGGTVLAGTTHRVRRGETLTGIARRYRVSVRSIRRVNALRSDHALRAGMRLRIPG
jgi:membrane-bound lytic murein transglycosylase D